MIALKSIALVLFLSFILFEKVLCKSEWYSVKNGKRFLIDFSKKYNWYEAMHKCSHHNLHLIEIKSPEKNLIVTELLNSIPKTMGFFWLGGTTDFVNQPKGSHSFYWIASGEYFSYTNWAHNIDGNALDNESCVHTWTNFTSYKWGVQPCHSFMFDLICEEYEVENRERKFHIDELINGKLASMTHVNNSKDKLNYSWRIIFAAIIWLQIKAVVFK